MAAAQGTPWREALKWIWGGEREVGDYSARVSWICEIEVGTRPKGVGANRDAVG